MAPRGHGWRGSSGTASDGVDCPRAAAGARPLIDQLRATYSIGPSTSDSSRTLEAAEQELVEHRQMRRSIDAQREAVLLMRDRGAIDDDVLRASAS
jgi:hypothetical protein